MQHRSRHRPHRRSAVTPGAIAHACVIGLLTLFFGGCAASPAYDGSTRMGPGFSVYQLYDNSRDWGPGYLVGPPDHHFGDEARIDDSRSAHINKPSTPPPESSPTYVLPPLP